MTRKDEADGAPVWREPRTIPGQEIDPGPESDAQAGGVAGAIAGTSLVGPLGGTAGAAAGETAGATLEDDGDQPGPPHGGGGDQP